MNWVCRFCNYLFEDENQRAQLAKDFEMHIHDLTQEDTLKLIKEMIQKKPGNVIAIFIQISNSIQFATCST